MAATSARLIITVIFMNDIARNNVISFVHICERFFAKYD